MLALPTLFDGTGNYTFTALLDNTSFNFEFNWNDRQGSWYFNLLDASNNPILTGRKIVLNLPMLHEFVGAAFPTGDLIALDSSTINLPPGLFDLGNRVILYYLTTDDLAQFKTILES